jgi:hypothetical protein
MGRNESKSILQESPRVVLKELLEGPEFLNFEFYNQMKQL